MHQCYGFRLTGTRSNIVPTPRAVQRTYYIFIAAKSIVLFNFFNHVLVVCEYDIVQFITSSLCVSLRIYLEKHRTWACRESNVYTIIQQNWIRKSFFFLTKWCVNNRLQVGNRDGTNDGTFKQTRTNNAQSKAQM